jgi:S1-C subfamily serine protease
LRRRFAFATAILFVVAIIIITIPFNGFILSSTTALAKEQQINPNTSSQGTNSSSSSNHLSLNTIFKQAENSVVQITSKTPTTSVSNPMNQSSNTTTLGSGSITCMHDTTRCIGSR